MTTAGFVRRWPKLASVVGLKSRSRSIREALEEPVVREACRKMRRARRLVRELEALERRGHDY